MAWTVTRRVARIERAADGPDTRRAGSGITDDSDKTDDSDLGADGDADFGPEGATRAMANMVTSCMLEGGGRWAFSTYLESVALLPQLFVFHSASRTGVCLYYIILLYYIYYIIYILPQLFVFHSASRTGVCLYYIISLYYVYYIIYILPQLFVFHSASRTGVGGWVWVCARVCGCACVRV